mmetsp:Transcript_24070/g.48607  ORF Transcript_24070/g.48607 Transcript_24070/m.48607 type:complete len:158 (+) Transcript_24070:1881-2354(+)
MFLVSSGLSSEIFLWDLKKIGKRSLKYYTLKGHGKNIVSTGVVRKNGLFFSIDSSFSIFKWSMDKFPICFQRKNLEKDKKFIHKNPLKPFPISFDFNGMFFSHGSSNGKTFLFSQQSGKIFKHFSDHFGNVNDISFHPKKKILCSCGNDGSLVVRDY